MTADLGDASFLLSIADVDIECWSPNIESLDDGDQNHFLDSIKLYEQQAAFQHQRQQQVQEQMPVQQQQEQQLLEHGPVQQQQEQVQQLLQQHSLSPASTQPMRGKDQEVHKMACILQLPLRTMNSWSVRQKHLWLKAFLIRHVPQPITDHVGQRLLQLSQAVKPLYDQGRLTLEEGVTLTGQYLDMGIARKLDAELKAWKRVCETLQVGIKQEPRTSSHGKGPGGDLLWEHVLRLLMEHSPTVQWLALEQGLFCFADSSGAARSWGNTKSNPNMSFEKMSRSIRQYYKEDGRGIIQKAVGQPKLHYRFSMTHPDVVSFLCKNFRSACEYDPFLSGIVASGAGDALLG